MHWTFSKLFECFRKSSKDHNFDAKHVDPVKNQETFISVPNVNPLSLISSRMTVRIGSLEYFQWNRLLHA